MADDDWHMVVRLPGHLQTPGVYPPTGLATYTETQGCHGDGGSGTVDGGVIEVVDIDDDEVRFRITGAPSFLSGTSRDGDYVAPRCN